MTDYIIGSDAIEGGNGQSLSWEPVLNASDTLALPAGCTLTSFNFYVRASAFSGNIDIPLVIYDRTDGDAAVYDDEVTITRETPGWYSITLDIDLSAYAGHELAISHYGQNNATTYSIGATEPKNTTTSVLEDPFVIDSYTGGRYSYYAVVSDSGGGITQTLTSPTDPIASDSTGNEVTASNFTGDLSSLTDQDSGYEFKITDQTTGTVTFNGPPLTTITEASGGVVVPEPGAAVTLVGTHTPTDPDEVATVATNISLPSGYAQVTLSGSSNVAGTVGYGIDAIHGVTVADGWIFVYPTADSTSVSADGTLYTNSDDLYIYGWNPTDDKMYGVRGLWVTPGGTAQKTFNIGIGISI